MAAMDVEFKSWIISQFRSDSDLREVILRTLKFDPGRAQQMVHDGLRIWGEKYPQKVEIHLDYDPREVLQALRENFAEQFAAIIQ